MTKKPKVVAVIKDDLGKPIWARIQYIQKEEDGKGGIKSTVLHDAVFIKGRKYPAVFLEKRVDNFIPPKRYEKMRKQAIAVITDKRYKQPLFKL